MSGYGFTPLPDAPRRVARPQARFDRRLPGLLFGRATLTYVCDQPVHVGAGHKVVVDGNPVRVQAGRGTDPVVPGSSWKGVVRTRFEAMTRSCLLMDSKAQGSTRDQFSACQLSGHPEEPVLCPACALFGAMNRRSRVSFGDLVADRPTMRGRLPRQYPPVKRPRSPARKFHGGRVEPQPGRFDVETIPLGAKLNGVVRFVNLTPSEMGGLVLALGWRGIPTLKVGAGKNLGFGRIRCLPVESELREPLTPTASLVQRVAAWESAYMQSPDRWERGETALKHLQGRGDW